MKYEIQISIVTVCRNPGECLRATIESVANQSYKNIQYIIIDGNSSDGTKELVEEYGKNVDVFISEKDNGIYDAMNKGISLATGELIGIINAGDTYNSDAVKQVVDMRVQTTQEEAIFYGGINKVDIDRRVVRVLDPVIKLEGLEKDMVLFHPSIFIPRIVYNAYGKYSDLFRISGDFDLLRRYYKTGLPFIRIDYNMADMMEGGVSENFKSIFLLSHESALIRSDGDKNIKYYINRSYSILIYILFFLKNYQKMNS